MKDSIKQLRALENQLCAYLYAQNCISYDEATVAPEGGIEGRGKALEVLSGAEFRLLVCPETAALLDAAERDAEDEQQAAEVRELRRRYEEISRIPADEYAAYALLTSNAQTVWGKAKRTDNYALFAPYLEKIVAAKRRFAACFDPDKDPYDVWLDRYERGASQATLDPFFEKLRSAIVPLLAQIQEKGKPVRSDFLNAEWPLAQQRELSKALMRLMTIDKEHCILGETEHPYTIEFYKEDVRITTHYQKQDFTSSMYSVIHESGHALYEMSIADRLKYTVLAGGSTMGVHESQSRLFENYVGRSRAFIHCVWPRLCALFTDQLAGVTEEEFYRLVNRAEPSLIRTEADELTYALHVMVRYELEKALMHGELTVEELPAAWNAKYKEYLGVDVPDDAHGVLQDIHWSCGDIGYFPSYALGSAYGAQIMLNMRKTLDVDGMIERRDFEPIVNWLQEKIWQYGREKEPAWLVENACGGPFDPQCFIDYLVKKYTELYEL